MMTEIELKDWRNLERNRLNDLVMYDSKEKCRLTINILNAVLQDD